MRSLLPTSRRRSRPSFALGVLVAVACLVVETSVGLFLREISPVQSLGVLYLIGLLLVASVWGFVLALPMAMVSTVIFDYFLLPPAWSLRLTRHEDLVILGVFIALTVLASVLARLARLLSTETAAREESDLSAELARLLLRSPELTSALPVAARKLAVALGLSSASISQAAITSDEKHVAIPLRGGGAPAALLVPADLSRSAMRRLSHRVVPSLEVLLEAARERERTATALRTSRDAFSRIAEEQAALRRLATLVAHTAPATVVFQAIAREMGQLLGVMHSVVIRYEPAGTTVVVGSWNVGREAMLPIGSRRAIEQGTVADHVFRTGTPARMDSLEGGGALSAELRSRGIISTVGCPIMVCDSLWGLAILASSTSRPLPDDAEARMLDFTELAAAALANARSDADLRASRARVVAASDAARRRIERDLHDGAQQRLVSLGLELRGIEAAIPPAREDLRRQVSATAKSLEETVIDLQELSRGLHPAVLAKGGLEPALTVLARRSALPIELEVSLPGRLVQQLEVTVYYVVSEALTNAAKHASASAVRVEVTTGEGLVQVSVHDNGIGGADPSGGSGLIGLTDRVEALGGRLSILSPAGGGTSLRADLPFEPAEGS
jgi:signal transduction histidine kinase